MEAATEPGRHHSFPTTAVPTFEGPPVLTEPQPGSETTAAPEAPPTLVGPAPLPPAPGVALPPDTFRYRLKNKLLGPPLHTEQLEHERLGKPTALAVFASDNLSSSAYATEEILRVLIPTFGVLAFGLVTPITIAMLIVLGFLILSYRQTIKAYPTAGGAYMVTRDNFGLLPAQVAGVALLTDYVLTVSVSVAAGTAALASAFSAFTPWILPISVLFVIVIALGNLRGVKESGRIFAVPTYFFMVMMVVLLGWGVYQLAAGHLPTIHPRDGHGAVRPLLHLGDPRLVRADVLRVARIRVRRRRGHRCRSDLQRCAGVPRTRVEERAHHARHHGHVARRHVPRRVGPGRASRTRRPS